MRNDTWRIGGDNHAPAPDLGPADPASTAPLDRLAVTLGATADLLAIEQPRAFEPAPDDCAALTGRLLALTVVAARHALSRLPLADADRPLVVGRYAEQALDELGSLGNHSMLTEVASFHPPTCPSTPNQALESALRTWAGAARAELARTIPSTAVLANIANHSVHLYAVADQLTATAQLGALPTPTADRARHQFRYTAHDLGVAGKLWTAVTTAQRPTHTCTTAATTLDTTLLDLTHDGPNLRLTADVVSRTDLGQALVDLRYAGTELIEFMDAARSVVDTLAQSQLLFAPARVLRATPERLVALQRGRFVAADLRDIPALTAATGRAVDAAKRGRAALASTAGPHTGHEPQPRLVGCSRLVPPPTTRTLSPGPPPGPQIAAGISPEL